MPRKTSKRMRKSHRKTARRHQRSTSGKVHLPLDVRSDKDLAPFKKLLGKHPLTIILVYATWCPHCHTMMPHFDQAAKSANLTVSPVKVNETMINKLNSYILNNVNKDAKPISVDGFPSIILVNNKAEKVTDIEPVRDTNTMKKLMEQSGTLAEQSGMLSKPNNRNKSIELSNANANLSLHLNEKNVNRNNSAKNVVKNVVENELYNLSNNIGSNKNYVKNMGSLKNKKNSLVPSLADQKEAEETLSITSPISLSDDMESLSISNKLSPEEKVGGGKRGGSLIGAMSRATYTLAPAAALLATAAFVMKQKTRKTSKKHRSHKKRN